MDSLFPISDSDLSKIGSGAGPNDLQKIAVRYLEVPQPATDTYKASTREDMEGFKFKLLEHWRNQNPDPDARQKLFDLLEKARKEGLINKQYYEFLLQPHGLDNTGEGLSTIVIINQYIHL